MQLSHSKVEKYNQCPTAYKLHYIDRIRPTTQTSALYFGSAMGLVLNALCLRKKPELTKEEAEEVKLGENPMEYFDELISEIEINGNTEPLPKSPNIRYYRKDYAPEILEKSDLEQIEEYAGEIGLMLGDRPAKFEDFIDEYLSHQIDDSDIVSFMNFQFYLSLRRKGRLMIDEFMENFFHKIIEVHSIEREIKIDLSLETDPEFTDYLIGYIDMECSYELCRDYDKNILKPFLDIKSAIAEAEKKEMKARKNLDKLLDLDQHDEDVLERIAENECEENKNAKKARELQAELEDVLKPGDIIRITTDFKTASTRYGTKKLTESSQLARYQYCVQNPYHGYFIFVKTLKTPKKGPRTGETFTEIQVMISERDQELENKVLDGDEIVLEKIQNGEFPKIPEKECRRVYGSFCQYYWYCHENKSMKGLTQK